MNLLNLHRLLLGSILLIGGSWTSPAIAETTVARVDGEVSGAEGRRLEAFMPLSAGEELTLGEGALVVLFHDGRQLTLVGPATGPFEDLAAQSVTRAQQDGGGGDLLRAAFRALSDWMFTDDGTVAIAGIRGGDPSVPMFIDPPSGALAPRLLADPFDVRVDGSALRRAKLRLVARDGEDVAASWTVRVADGRVRVPRAALAAERIEVRSVEGEGDALLAVWTTLTAEEGQRLESALEEADAYADGGYEAELLRAALFAETGCYHQANEALQSALALGVGRPEIERATLQPWSPLSLQLGAQWRPAGDSARWLPLARGSAVPSGARLSFTPRTNHDARILLLGKDPGGAWMRLLSGRLDRYGIAADGPGSRRQLTSVDLDLDQVTGAESLVFVVSHMELEMSREDVLHADDVDRLTEGCDGWYRPDGRHQGQGYGQACIRIDFDHIP